MGARKAPNPPPDPRCKPVLLRRRPLADRIRRLAEQWTAEQDTYPDTSEGRYAAAVLRSCCRELIALIEEEP